MKINDKAVVSGFIDLYLSLNCSQRETLLELLAGYDFMVSLWNSDHPISVKSTIIDNILFMHKFREKNARLAAGESDDN